MPRLHSDSSRPYPGRPVRHAVAVLAAPRMATCRVDRAGVSRSHSRRRTLPKGGMVTENELSKSERGLTPLKGQTQSRELVHMCSETR